MSGDLPPKRHVEALFTSARVDPETSKFTINVVTRDGELITITADQPGVSLLATEAVQYVAAQGAS